jgi:hypothetical protein
MTKIRKRAIGVCRWEISPMLKSMNDLGKRVFSAIIKKWLKEWLPNNELELPFYRHQVSVVASKFSVPRSRVSTVRNVLQSVSWVVGYSTILGSWSVLVGGWATLSLDAGSQLVLEHMWLGLALTHGPRFVERGAFLGRWGYHAIH